MFSSTQKRNKKSDAELVTDYKTFDDYSAFEELFARYSHLIFCVCKKYLFDEEDSRDATMEIFEKISIEIKKYKISNFKSWLYQITRNYCTYKQQRAKAFNVLEKKISYDEKKFMENSDFSTLVSERTIQKNELINAINQLEKNQKTCICLFYFEEKTYQQISDETGFDFKQVKSYIQNGKRNLKNLLKRNEAFKDVYKIK